VPYSSKWIRGSTRLAIYIRDNLCCIYCLRSYKETALGIDHVKSRARGGDNRWNNLVTCCPRCNNLLLHNVKGTGRARLAIALNLPQTEIPRRVKRARSRSETRARVQALIALREKPDWLAELKTRSTNLPREEEEGSQINLPFEGTRPCDWCTTLCPWCDPKELAGL